MAVDILQLLVEILQISPQLVNEYSSQGPIYQLFYLFFFPMVFIVILVWMVMERFSRHRGLSILIGIAVLAFIILQGWYSFFAYLSRFWILIVVIIAAFMAFFSFRGKKEGGTVKGRAVAASSGIFAHTLKQAGKRTWKNITGELPKREEMIRAMLTQVRDAIKMARGGDIKDVDNLIGGAGGSMRTMQNIYGMIMDLWREGEIMGFPEDRVKKLIKEYNDVARQLKSVGGADKGEIKEIKGK